MQVSSAPNSQLSPFPLLVPRQNLDLAENVRRLIVRRVEGDRRPSALLVVSTVSLRRARDKIMCPLVGCARF